MEYIFDIPLAVWYINPAMEYRLDHSVPPHIILEWRGPGEQPTERQMLDALAAHTRLTVSAQTIRVESAPDVAEIILLIGTDEYLMALTNGVGEVTINFPPGETEYTVSLKDKVRFGPAEAVVYA